MPPICTSLCLGQQLTKSIAAFGQILWIGHLHDGVILLQLPEFHFVFLFKFKFCNPRGEQRTIALINMIKQKPEGFW